MDNPAEIPGNLLGAGGGSVSTVIGTINVSNAIHQGLHIPGAQFWPEVVKTGLEKIFEDPRVKGVTGQLEEGTHDHRRHVQFTVLFENRLAFSVIHSIVNAGFHDRASPVAPPHGELQADSRWIWCPCWVIGAKKPADAWAYCNKPTSDKSIRICGPWSFGTEPQQGKRNDVSRLYDALKSGKRLRDIAQDDATGPVLLKYYRGSMAMRLLFAKNPVVRTTIVFWHYGPTGVGKTHSVFVETNTLEDPNGGDKIYIKDGTNKWWDGFDGHEYVLIDDLDASIGYKYLLRCLDKYSFRGETKGLHVSVADFNGALGIYITCSKAPRFVFQDVKGIEATWADQLERRITVCRRFYLEDDGTRKVDVEWDKR